MIKENRVNKIIQATGYLIFFALFAVAVYFVLCKKVFHLQISAPVFLIWAVLFLALGRIIRKISQWDL